MEIIRIEKEDLKNALNKLNLYYPEDKLRILSQKEVYRINNAIEIIKNNFNTHNIKDYKNDDFLIEILVEYISIMTMSLADVIAITLVQIFNLNMNNEYIYFSKIKNKFNSLSSLEQKIINQVNSIEAMDEYKYIKALCNHVKHNEISDTQIIIKSSSENAISLVIKDFMHKNTPYSLKTIKDFIECHYAVKNELFKIFQIFIDYEKSKNSK